MKGTNPAYLRKERRSIIAASNPQIQNETKNRRAPQRSKRLGRSWNEIWQIKNGNTEDAARDELERESDRFGDPTRIILKRFAAQIVVPDVTSRPTASGISDFARQKGKLRTQKGEHLMKTPMKSKRHSRGFLLSILCAGVLATFLGGCAEGPYVYD